MSRESAANDQILDAVKQVSKLLGEGDEGLRRPLAFQVMVQAITMAMQNAVAQQQQAYTLRNAATTAAVRAILEADPREALELAGKTLPGEDVVATLGGLMELLEELEAAYSGEPASAKAKSNRSTSGRADSKPSEGGKKR